MSASNVPKWPPRNKANIIPKEDYAKLRSMAEAHAIALSGVKRFDGSAEVVGELLRTLIDLQRKFPAVYDERYRLTLSFGKMLSAQDFAITHGKVVGLNEDAFRDVKLLAEEYRKAMETGWFVQGTTWRAILHHEFGHVVSDVYKLDGLKIACEITGLHPKETLVWLKKNLSAYAGSFPDGGEIISEVFADISTGKPSEFSRKFYGKVLEMTR